MIGGRDYDCVDVRIIENTSHVGHSVSRIDSRFLGSDCKPTTVGIANVVGALEEPPSSLSNWLPLRRCWLV